MKRVLFSLSLCILISISSIQAQSSRTSPVFRKSDLPMMFYLDYCDESYLSAQAAMSFYWHLRGKLKETQVIRRLQERWSTVDPETRKRLGSNVLATNYSWYYLEILRHYLGSKKDAIAWMKDGEILGALSFDQWEKCSFSQELSRRYQKDIRLMVSVNPEIIGGMIIQAEDLLVDGSFKGHLRKIRQSIRQRM